ncbi:MAG: hypothetical protein ACREMQ_03885 [Longimicrobiales bacterium]
MKRTRCALVLALVFSVFACRGDAGQDDAGVAEDSTVTPPPPPTDSLGMGVPAPRDTTRPPGSIGDVTDSEIVVATVDQNGIQLSRDTLPAGEITVVVENKAEAPCAMEVVSGPLGVRHLGAPVRRGSNLLMSMVLSRSPYYLFCTGGGSGSGPVATRDSARLIVR